MILILSTYGDLTTTEVIAWLQSKNAAYFRLNDNDIFKYNISVKLSANTAQPYFSIDTGEVIIHSEEITTVWFRKFGFYFKAEAYKVFEKCYGDAYLSQFKSEYLGTLNLLCRCLSKKKWLADYRSVRPDKFMVLNKAQSVGLRVPASTITNNKTALFDDMPDDIIAKSLSDISFIETKDRNVLTMYTFPLKPLKKFIPGFFLPTLIQEEIKKEFEIRTFYIDGQFFSMAIFSQNDPQTKADFRKYNYLRPNRFVPYTLDKNIEQKLTILLQEINLNTGSLDLIFTPQGETVLLEVNPCGQFGMMSQPCNYPLEEIVANTLIKFAAD